MVMHLSRYPINNITKSIADIIKECMPMYNGEVISKEFKHDLVIV